MCTGAQHCAQQDERTAVGRLWELIENYRKAQPYPPSGRRIAERLGVAPTTLSNWKHPITLPSRENLEAIAEMVGLDYETVLNIALSDTRYLNDDPPPAAEKSGPVTVSRKSTTPRAPKGAAGSTRSRR